MIRIAIALALFASYVLYSALVFTKGTELPTGQPALSAAAARGKELYQQYNCQACHQLFGLGGYLGPDLTHAWSDPRRGPLYLNALLQSGGSRMPDFHLSTDERECLLAYLRSVDQSSTHEPPRPR
ncbi:c-type cytochrome [Flaviaesturariibacter terrae]